MSKCKRMNIVNVIGYAGSKQKIEIFRTGVFHSALTQTHINQADKLLSTGLQACFKFNDFISYNMVQLI